MTFREWTDQLRATGHLLCPASSAVPVELRGLRPDGTGFHFRCRGVRVKLALYRPGRAAWQVPLWDDRWCPEEALSLWEHHSVGVGGVPDGRGLLDGGMPVDPADPSDAQPRSNARLVFDDPAHPDRFAFVDGAEEWGWKSYEAGLLGPTAAAALFDQLGAEVDAVWGGAGWDSTQGVAVAGRAQTAERTEPCLATLIPHVRECQPILAAARTP